ncbi:MAG: hypothetical protein L0Y71_03890 [Gemmataceae bacterium]|nr:hypothetical protein [Gemmataceae bacterium]
MERTCRYQIMPPDADGVWRSRVFPGLWLDGPALLRREVTCLLATLRQGLHSADHQAFVERLAKAKVGR